MTLPTAPVQYALDNAYPTRFLNQMMEFYGRLERDKHPLIGLGEYTHSIIAGGYMVVFPVMENGTEIGRYSIFLDVAGKPDHIEYKGSHPSHEKRISLCIRKPIEGDDRFVRGDDFHGIVFPGVNNSLQYLHDKDNV